MKYHFRFGPVATAILLPVYIIAAIILIRAVEDFFSPFYFHVR